MNLLPQADKSAIKQEYYRRLAVVAAVFFLVIILIGMIPLTTAYIVAMYQISNLNKEINFTNQSNLARGTGANEAIIKDVNSKIDLLNAVGKDDLGYDISAIYASIIASSTAKITSLAYDQVQVKKGTTKEVAHRIVVSGVAADRSQLQAFVKVLKSDSRFASVDLPISDLIASSNIDFSITIIMSKRPQR